MGWLVGRYRAGDRTDQREADLVAILRQHGLEPADIMTAAVVTETKDGRYQMHFSRLARSATGGRVLDVAADQVVSEPVVIDVERGAWPDWLTGMNVPVPS